MLENVSVPNLASTTTLGNLSVASLPTTTSSDLSVFQHNVQTSKPLENNVMEALNLAVTEEYEIPSKFPNLKTLKKGPVL